MVQHKSYSHPVKGDGHGIDPFSFDPAAFEANGYVRPRRPKPPRPQKQCEGPIEQEENYVAIVVGKDGQMQFRSSANLKQVREAILRPAVQGLLQYVHRDSIHREAAIAQVNLEPLPTPRDTHDGPVGGSISNPFSRSHKRPRADTDTGAGTDASFDRGSRSSRLSTLPNGSRKTTSIQLGDTEQAAVWISEAFEAVQQVGCRLVAKLWIKKIHPKKQSTNPYNGGFPKDNPIKDPERTKPPYWPTEVEHKEPDHIQKQQRITLLTHLIMHTPYTQLVPRGKQAEDIDAAALQVQTEERRKDIPKEKWEILQDIFRLRTMMEGYERGEYDDTVNVNVIDCGKSTRLEQGETENDIADDDDEDGPAVLHDVPEDDDEEPEATQPSMMTPESSDIPSPSDQQHSQKLVLRNGNASGLSQDAPENMNVVQTSTQGVRRFGASFSHTGSSSRTVLPSSRTMSEGEYRAYGRSLNNPMLMAGVQFQPADQHQHDRQQWTPLQNLNHFSSVSHMVASGNLPDTMMSTNTLGFDQDMFNSSPLGGLPSISSHGMSSGTEVYDQTMRQSPHGLDLRYPGMLSELATQEAGRGLPYRGQGPQQMIMNRQNSYDDPVIVHGTFYHNG